MDINRWLLASSSAALVLISVSYSYQVWKQTQFETRKRARLDHFYKAELNTAYFFYLSPERTPEDLQWAISLVEETQQHMLEDGYDRFEVDTFLKRAHEENRRHWDEVSPSSMSNESLIKF